MAFRRRIRVWVDGKLQGGFCLRVVLYWFFCQAAILLMLGCYHALREPPNSSVVWLQSLWSHYGPALVGSTLILPMLLLDCLCFSNRLAGPLFRLRKAMTDLADGKQVAPLHFRENDFCQDIAHQFNRIRVQRQAEHADPPASEPEPCGTPIGAGNS